MEQTLRIKEWVSQPAELDMRKGMFQRDQDSAGLGGHREAEPMPLARNTAAGVLQS